MGRHILFINTAETLSCLGIFFEADSDANQRSQT